MAAELGVDVNNEKDIAQFQGGQITNAVAFIEKRLGKPVPDNFIDEFRRRSYAAYDKDLQAIPGVAKMLEQVTLPFCVASSGPVEKIRRNLNTVGLLPKFKGHIFSCYDINRWKPEPDIFLYAAKEMGANSEQCVVVEDSVLGVRARVAAGMIVLGYAGTEPAQKLAQEGARVFIRWRNCLHCWKR